MVHLHTLLLTDVRLCPPHRAALCSFPEFALWVRSASGSPSFTISSLVFSELSRVGVGELPGKGCAPRMDWVFSTQGMRKHVDHHPDPLA